MRPPFQSHFLFSTSLFSTRTDLHILSCHVHAPHTHQFFPILGSLVTTRLSHIVEHPTSPMYTDLKPCILITRRPLQLLQLTFCRDITNHTLLLRKNINGNIHHIARQRAGRHGSSRGPSLPFQLYFTTFSMSIPTWIPRNPPKHCRNLQLGHLVIGTSVPQIP